MDAAQLVEHGRREDERIPIGQPEAAVEIVEHIGESEPMLKPLRKGAEAATLGQGGTAGSSDRRGCSASPQATAVSKASVMCR